MGCPGGRNGQKKQFTSRHWPIGNSRIDFLIYLRVSSLRYTSSEAETEFPAARARWRETIECFNLDDEFKLSERVDVIGNFAKIGWGAQSKLPLISPTQLRAALEGHRKSTAATQLWAAATLLFADLSPASFLVLNGDTGNAEKVPHRLNNAALRNNADRSDAEKAIGKPKPSNPPKDFNKLGPSGKLNALLESQIPQYVVNRFFRTASQSIDSDAIRRCLTSFASGIRRYYIFRELRGTPPFPTREMAITEWISIFKHGQTFPNYVGYVRKFCYYLELTITCDTPAVKNCIVGPKLAGEGEFRFPNCIRRDFIANITDYETRGGDFAQLPPSSTL